MYLKIYKNHLLNNVYLYQVWNDFVNSTEEEQAEFLKTGVLHVEENGNQVDGDAENNNGGLDETWECVPRTSDTDKRSSMSSCINLRGTVP